MEMKQGMWVAFTMKGGSKAVGIIGEQQVTGDFFIDYTDCTGFSSRVFFEDVLSWYEIDINWEELKKK